MTALTLSPFSFLAWTFRKYERAADDTARFDDVERRKIVGDLIAAGACESEYGVEMLMSVCPDRF
ncbi:hypothetical protein MAA5396_04826 [Marinovum algicola]|uniref:Uncharacterized protein n=1 Tax=Marinovum algicola TaxID=42444 RepID=A0A975WF19_9RHOB|nr:hypothetical protein [Marinovum algicola]SEK09623.1 hypothetical protein SAMN04487940_13041 [Marinovum algicola]SLN76812.1 hypothetical protein MAA5396_04826 [Marinovum algicola]